MVLIASVWAYVRTASAMASLFDTRCQSFLTHSPKILHEKVKFLWLYNTILVRFGHFTNTISVRFGQKEKTHGEIRGSCYCMSFFLAEDNAYITISVK